MNSRTWIKIALILRAIFLGSFLIPPIMWVSGNAVGVCFAEGRILSEKEIAAKVIRGINKDVNSINVPTGGPFPTPVDVVKYNTLAEAIRANPNCCHLKSEPHDDTGPPFLFTYLIGVIHYIIEVKYNFRYRTADGTLAVSQETFMLRTDSCGDDSLWPR